MNTHQARAIVRETFPQPFDKGRFRQFAINLLNHIDQSKATAWNSTYIKDAFKDHVKAYERLGTYTSPDQEKLDVLIVHLTTESKLERARTAIRNFVADHLKTRDGKDAALVAFVSPTEKQWRFSYVKMEYAAVEQDDGKVGVRTKLTPARRSSYIVGEGESCHTAQSRFLDLLQDTENHPTLAQIEDAFSVEAVTKEFFEQYKALFLDLKDELDDLAKQEKTIGAEFAAKKVNTADFPKKLMGQIVFLYFLQKKGWLGVAKGGDWGDGPHNFLRQLFDGRFGAHKNFFNDILEPLFYDTLATDRGHDAWCKIFNCRIPFLNGGLFEPLRDYDWHKTDILIPNSLFSNTKTTDAGDTGTGILDVFDRYNFTVNEAEPLEKEVAIDPEMLGKVFENLLGVMERKSKGSFYTPREIVHYMCQESLINYLDTAINFQSESIAPEKRKQAFFGDEKAEQTLLTAPAYRELVPRKDLETFIHLGEQISHYEAVDAKYPIKMPATIAKHARLIDEKLATITVCDPAVGSGAYPVGMMQEIVRARSALTPYFNDVHERTAYHFKRHAIQNCLYGVDIDPGAVEIAKLRLWLSLVVDEDDVKRIKPLPNLDYKIVVGNSLMGVEKNLFNADLFKRLEELKPKYFDATDRKQKEKFKHEIDDLIHELTNGKEVFDFEIYFSEVFHKKGGFDVVIANPPYVSYGLRGGQKMTDQDKALLRELFPQSAEYKISLYALFIDIGIRISRPDGGVQTFITPDSFLLGMYFSKIRAMILDQNCIVEILLMPYSVFRAVVGYSAVYLFQRTSHVPAQHQLTAKLALTNEEVGRRSFRSFSYPQSYYAKSHLKRFRLFFTAADKLFVEKIETLGVPAKKFAKITTGVRSKVGQEAVVSDRKKGATWKKGIISSAQVKPYVVTWNGFWLNLDIEYLFSGGWDARFVEREKLMIPQTGDSIVAGIDSEGLYHLNNVHTFALTSDELDIKYVCAILNSRVINKYYHLISLEEGRVMAQTDIETLDLLPIKVVTLKEQKKVIAVVEQLLAAKRRDAEADTSALERELDELVYALYDLTPAEIKIVESAAK